MCLSPRFLVCYTILAEDVLSRDSAKPRLWCCSWGTTWGMMEKSTWNRDTSLLEVACMKLGFGDL